MNKKERLRSLLPIEAFLPRMVLADPSRRVFPCQGSVLRIRLAGFSVLAARLENDGPVGAEELYQVHNRWLDIILQAVDHAGGDVLEIGSSDITAFFPDERAPEVGLRRCLGAAVSIRDKIRELAPHTFRERASTLSTAMGVACGVVHGLLLGDEAHGHLVAFMGAALEEATRAAALAGPEHILLQPSAGARLSPDDVFTLPQLPTPAMTRLESLRVDPGGPTGPFLEPRHAVGACFLGPIVQRLIEEGLPAPAYRRLTTMVALASGVDPSTAGNIDALQEWFGGIQQALAPFDGHIASVRVGLGTAVEIWFGAPFPLGGEEPRALRAALALQRAARAIEQVGDQRIGIASGTAYLGVAGNALRYQCAAIGLRVDLTSHLAQHAGPWEVVAERHTVSRSGFGFDWGPPPSVPSGADAELLSSRILYGEGAYGTKLTSRSRGGILGRDELMESLRIAADQAGAGKGRLLILQGDAGIGKSALLLWLGQLLQDVRRVPVYRGDASMIERHSPYRAWIPIIRDWMDLQPSLSTEDMRARLAQRVRSLGEDLLPRLPLLDMVTGLVFAENAATRSLDAAQRRQALHGLILEMFRRAHARNPVAFILEDAQWMDEASVELLRYLARNIADLPILFALSRRPDEPDQNEQLDTLESFPSAQVIRVGAMDAQALAQLACRHFGARRLEPELHAVLIERSGGIPLFLEELTLYLRDTEHVYIDGDGEARLAPGVKKQLPSTMKEVIRGRVARLDEGTQLTLKAASVFGRTFTLSLLQEIYPVPFDMKVMLARLERMEGLDIVRRDASGLSRMEHAGCDDPALPASIHEQQFFFKHALICDTVYESLTAATRRTLHEAAGAALERRMTPENRSALVLSVAEHYRRTMRLEKQRQYFREAGDILRARALHRDAVKYYQAAEHLCQLAGDLAEVARVLESEIEVLNLLGDREEQRKAIERFVDLSRELRDEQCLANALRFKGIFLGRTGDPQGALQVLEDARAHAQARNDAVLEARILRAAASVMLRRHQMKEAKDACETALELSLSAGSYQDVAVIEANLGTVLGQMGRVAEGRDRLEQALNRAQSRGDLRWSGIFLSELGVLALSENRFDEAIGLFERALSFKERVGERLEEAITLNNLGYAWMSVGRWRRARRALQRAIAIARQVDSPYAEASATENLAVVLEGEGRIEDARALFTSAIALHEATNADADRELCTLYLARLELDSNQTESARALLRPLVEKAEPSAMTKILWSRVLAQSHAIDEALELLDSMALETNKTSVIEKFLLHFDAALVYHQRKSETAKQLLEFAWNSLKSRAECIADEELRQAFLQDVPRHRRLAERLEHIRS